MTIFPKFPLQNFVLILASGSDEWSRSCGVLQRACSSDAWNIQTVGSGANNWILIIIRCSATDHWYYQSFNSTWLMLIYSHLLHGYTAMFLISSVECYLQCSSLLIFWTYLFCAYSSLLFVFPVSLLFVSLVWFDLSVCLVAYSTSIWCFFTFPLIRLPTFCHLKYLPESDSICFLSCTSSDIFDKTTSENQFRSLTAFFDLSHFAIMFL